MINAFLIDGHLIGTTATSVLPTMTTVAGAGPSLAVGIFWAPGTVAKTTGGSIGIGVSGTAGSTGVGVGLSWAVSEGMSGAKYAIPGISIDVLYPAGPASPSIVGGYTWKNKEIDMLIH
jgi:hypothetical protein